MYSLTNIATVVRDLARHPRAAGLATDLLLAFGLTAADLDELDRAPYDQAHRLRREALIAGSRSDAAAFASVAAGAVGRPVTSSAEPSVEALGNATIGGIDDLVAFLRHDVVAAAWRGAASDLAVCLAPTALDIVTDGVVAQHSNDTSIGAAWRRWAASASTPASPAPATLDAVRLLDPGSAPMAPAAWVEHMHDACWAVHLTGRQRLAAVAQLHSLRALVSAVGPQPRHALVATVVASTHAEVVADVLPSGVVDAMTRPLRRLIG